MTSGEIITATAEHEIPPGALGPEPVVLDVRAYLVPHATGLVLVDTGMEATGEALTTALADAGADWADVSDVMLTHANPDHVGALGAVRASTPQPRIHAHPSEAIADSHDLGDGDVVGSVWARYRSAARLLPAQRHERALRAASGWLPSDLLHRGG